MAKKDCFTAAKPDQLHKKRQSSRSPNAFGGAEAKRVFAAMMEMGKIEAA